MGNTFYENRAGVLVPAEVVRQELEREAPGFVAVVKSMLDEPVGVEINTSTWKVYLLLQALQLTVSHPTAPFKANLTELGRDLQAILVHHYPAIAPTLEAGWHRDLDVPVEEGT